MQNDSKPVMIRLAQISQRVGQNFYLPYSVGLLQAYAQAYLKTDVQFLPPLYRRMLLPEALQAFSGVDLAGFSVYVWNIRRSLLIAEALKAQQPQTLIVFGGPQVPDAAKDFLRQHPFVDLCVHGAGEEVFTLLLERFALDPQARDWSGIPGLSWLDAEGEFCYQPPAARTRDLSDYPSPFLSGVFDPLLAEYPYWFTPFETNRGCPFSCSFCDWGSALASKVVRIPEERLWAEIAWLGRNRIKSVFCTDANFGILPRDLEIAHEVARIRQLHGYPQAFQIQTAKNVTGRVVDIQRVLTAAGLSATAAISLQSLNAEALKNIKRQNISLEAFKQIHQACLEHGIFTYTDIIMSLPGESYETFVSGIESVMTSGQYTKIIFHDATLLPNAGMAQPDYMKTFGLETTLICVPGHSIPPDGVPELMEIVVATKDLSRQDWVRLHVYAWMTSFLFYTHKLLQLALLLLHETLGCSYRCLINLFCEGDLSEYPILQRIRETMLYSARQQQKGYPHSNHHSLVLTPAEGTYLTPDLTMQLELGQEGLLDGFYLECLDLLMSFARLQQADYPFELLHQTMRLNRRHFIKFFLKQGFPLNGLQTEPETLQLTYNLPEYFQALLKGQRIELLPGQSQLVSV